MAVKQKRIGMLAGISAIALVGIAIVLLSGRNAYVLGDPSQTAANTEITAVEKTKPTQPGRETNTPKVADQPLVSTLPGPTPRGGLESTNPEIVNLASGEIQLVEFFAFW
jgi:hypothetical protein